MSEIYVRVEPEGLLALARGLDPVITQLEDSAQRARSLPGGEAFGTGGAVLGTGSTGAAWAAFTTNLVGALRRLDDDVTAVRSAMAAAVDHYLGVDRSQAVLLSRVTT